VRNQEDVSTPSKRNLRQLPIPEGHSFKRSVVTKKPSPHHNTRRDGRLRRKIFAIVKRPHVGSACIVLAHKAKGSRYIKERRYSSVAVNHGVVKPLAGSNSNATGSLALSQQRKFFMK
jgi:hypothetical protein